MRANLKKLTTIKTQEKKDRVVKIYRGNMAKEIYTSSISRGIIRGWKLHKKMTCRLTVIIGKVRIIIKSKKGSLKYILEEKSPKLILIKPNTWFAFEGIAKKNIILNVANYFHSPAEMIKDDIKKK